MAGPVRAMRRPHAGMTLDFQILPPIRCPRSSAPDLTHPGKKRRDTDHPRPDSSFHGSRNELRAMPDLRADLWQAADGHSRSVVLEKAHRPGVSQTGRIVVPSGGGHPVSFRLLAAPSGIWPEFIR